MFHDDTVKFEVERMTAELRAEVKRLLSTVEMLTLRNKELEIERDDLQLTVQRLSRDNNDLTNERNGFSF